MPLVRIQSLHRDQQKNKAVKSQRGAKELAMDIHAINDNKNKHKNQMVIALKLEWYIMFNYICLNYVAVTLHDSIGA